MKLSVVAYYKFSELPPGLTFARHWNVSKYGLGDAFGERGGGGPSLGGKAGPHPQSPGKALNYNSHNTLGHPASLPRVFWVLSIMGIVVQDWPRMGGA